MSLSAPLISIITPTFNRAGYIAETLQSILDQDYPSIELIVVNDGSTDGTTSVLSEFTNRIRVINQSNSGQTASVNRGFAASHGEYLAVINDDDPLRPGALAALVDALESDLDALVAYPDWELIDAAGETVFRMTTPEYSLADMVRFHLCFPGPGAIFRRRALDLVGGWDPRFRWVADYDFWMRVGLVGSLIRVPKFLATWRRHPTGATGSTARLPMADEQIEVTRLFFERSDLPPEIARLRDEAMGAAFFVAATVALENSGREVLPRFEITDRTDRFLVTRQRAVGETMGDSPSETIAWQAQTIVGQQRIIDSLRYDTSLLENHINALDRTLELVRERADRSERR